MKDYSMLRDYPGVAIKRGAPGFLDEHVLIELSTASQWLSVIRPHLPPIVITRGGGIQGERAHSSIYVVDLRSPQNREDSARLLYELEKWGFATMDLGPAQGYERHVHAVLAMKGASLGARCPTELNPFARAQVDAYNRRRVHPLWGRIRVYPDPI